nr:MAG: RNA-dependent RNA polymerase [Leptosphaeria biglobosa narnavirus 4]
MGSDSEILSSSSRSGEGASFHTASSGNTYGEAVTIQPWIFSTDVLPLSSFPSTSVLRGRHKQYSHTCKCADGDRHRNLFDAMQTVIIPHMRDQYKPLEGLKVCWDAENIWECKLPKELTGLDKRLEFKQLPNVGVAEKVLYRGTYWFRRLISSRKSGLGRNATGVLRLLAGLSSMEGPEPLNVILRKKLCVSAVNKLRSCLATIDGLLMQLTLALPEEGFNDWDTLDRITNSLVSCSIPDLFRGESGVNRITTFEKVKKIRGRIKEEGFNPIGNINNVEVPQELSFFRSILKRVEGEKTPIQIYKIMMLSQTRASGVPPRSVYFKTLAKIRDILQEEPSSETFSLFKPFLGPAMNSIHQELLASLGGNENRDRFFDSCANAAKISLSDSGEFFTKSEDGGKLEAARRVLNSFDSIQRIDLITGEFTGRPLTKEKDSQGELLFAWACNQFHDRNHVYEKNVMSTRISLVAELGKYRAVTVSHLAHAILLHVLSHVLLEYLKVIPSSESGVKAANHAWNFFKRLSHKNPSGNFLFENEEVLLFSTDWEQASDFIDHNVARAIMAGLCYSMGIPKWYAQTCTFALCAPRQVEYLDPEGKTLECFLTKRGVFMGDPVTKVILHTYHLVSRQVAKQLVNRMRKASDPS